jgi:hypothetical protein
MYESLGVIVHRYSEFLTAEEIQEADRLSTTLPVHEISNHVKNGIAVGEHALAGALRFFARGNLDGEPQGENVLRRYFKASLLTMFATERLVRTHQFESAVFHHGIYVVSSAKCVGATGSVWSIGIRPIGPGASFSATTIPITTP